MKDHIKSVVDFLESEGWKIAVINDGGRIEQTGDRKYNFSFVIDFTGVKQNKVNEKVKE